MTAALRRSTSTSARQKSERLIREGLLQSNRTLFTQLEYWAPLLEAELYILATAYSDLLDAQRHIIKMLAPTELGIAAQAYWRAVAAMGRATLLATSPGASGWLVDMPRSFTWSTWTPSFPLVRDRSLWTAMIGARSAAEFGPSVIESYGNILARAEHPVNALDAIVGLTSVALRHANARREVVNLLKLEQARLNHKSAQSPEFITLGFSQALKLLEADAEESRAQGSGAPAFRHDPFEVNSSGDSPIFRKLRQALILPASAFIAPSRTLRSEGDMSASAASLMFTRAWLPPVQNTPPRVLH